MKSELNILIAGAAGQGMQTVGFLLGKIYTRLGYHVFANQDNESRIRGGHNFFKVRISAQEVKAPSQKNDVLIAMNGESVEMHRDEIDENGFIIFDSEDVSATDPDERFFGIPLGQIAKKSGSTLYRNSAALGAVFAFLGEKIGLLTDFLADFFAHKGEAATGNVEAAREGYGFTRQNYRSSCRKHETSSRKEGAMFLSGHEAVSIGALASGCRFLSAYPMSPSTSILTYLAGKADEFDLVVEQAEDEIAALNMALGASYGGVRSMTVTSGGGFSLMTEALGLAGVAELPVVIVNAQRPGPATGLPTRTEQGDLLFVLHASQGEFPRAVFAPGDAEQAYYLTIKAFYLAEKYQMPVIILTDQFLADSYYTHERFTVPNTMGRRYLASKKDVESKEPYLRYRITDDGISPRAVPGLSPVEVAADSHEHTEDGHITEDKDIRTRMVRKRFNKMGGIRKEVESPLLIGDSSGETLLVSWGSNLGPLSGVIEALNREGVSIRGMHISQVWPLPAEEIYASLTAARGWTVIENNFTGQLSRLLQMELQVKPDSEIHRFDGRPFTVEELVERVKAEVLQ